LDDETICTSPVLIPSLDFDMVTHSVRERGGPRHVGHENDRERWSEDEVNSRVADAHSFATRSRRTGES
jgi:hypothetical protein